MLYAEKSTLKSRRKSGQQRLGLNAAFLQDIKDDDRFLNELLLATRNAISESDFSTVRIRALTELLSRLRDRLALRFSMEEAFGYFEDALDFPKSMSTNADLYRSQHAALYLDVCDMVEAAERMVYGESHRPIEQALQRISASFASFYRRFQQHEAGENDLIDVVITWHRLERRQRGGLASDAS